MKKKCVIFLALIFAASIVGAQTAKRTSAYNYLRYGNLDKAKQAIDEASQNEQTMADAKTWYYRGSIYLEIANTKEEKYKGLDANPLQTSLESYEKALKYDTRKDYLEDNLPRIDFLHGTLYNQAADAFSRKDYIGALTLFESAAKIYTYVGAYDTLSMYNAAICSENAKMPQKSKDIFIDLLNKNFNQPQIYVSLSTIYKDEGDKNLAYKTIADGKAKYPNDFNLIIAETNLFLSYGETEKALNNLKIAVQKDTTNPTIYFAIGTNYNIFVDDTTKSEKVRSEAFKLAEDSYKKSIKLRPEFFDANYNLGALYVNKAVAIFEIANKLPLDATEKFNQLKVDADVLLNLALPNLEKAAQLQPNDLNTLYSLKQLYSRLNQLEKLKMVNEQIDQLQK